MSSCGRSASSTRTRDRRQTGRRTWLEGNAERLARAGGGLLGSWPAGRWQAPFGDFFAAQSGGQPGPVEQCWQLPDSHFLAALPRDPQVLCERLRADSPDDRPGYAGPFVYAADALRTGRVPADLRAALYRALLLPGVEIGEADDQDGTRHISMAVDDGVRRNEIFISSADGQFAGERATLTRAVRGLTAGTVTTDTAVRVAIVDVLGRLPADA
jgi:hypothetical protein